MSESVPQPLRAIAIVGSLRAASFNRSLLENVVRLSPPELEIETFDRLGEIPLFNEDVASSAVPEAVMELSGRIRQADALIVVTPEYNFGVPGVLKNALDYVSLPPGRSALEHKAVAILGASPSILGTARAQSQLRQSFTFTQSYVVNSPEVFVTKAHTRFEDGVLTDPGATKLIQQLLGNLVDLTRMLQNRPARSVSGGAA